MEKFVIDTNFFLNLEIKSGFGDTQKDVISNFTVLAKKLKQKKAAEFFMPPKIIDEFLDFFEKKEFISEFLNVMTVKSPETSKLQFPSSVFYQLIDEVRQRAYRGLRVAEEAVEDGAKKTLGKTLVNKIEFQKTLGETIKTLREKYRQATRFNFLDSVADLDLIVLAKEIDGFLVSSDEGVIRWGRLFGVKEVLPPLFRERLDSLLSAKK
jgi:RNA ligase partner protein